MQQKLKENFLSLGGIGHNKKAPGTMGSFLALVFIVVLKNFLTVDPIILFLSVIIILAVIYFLAVNFIRDLIKEGEYDRQWIVIDEFIGMTIAGLPFLYVYPFNGWLLILGFLLFRFFDIFKFSLIKKADSINSPQGVLLDDIIAGISTVISIVIGFFIFYGYS